MYYGAIEAGGTKFRAAVYQTDRLVKEITIPTEEPEETMTAVIAFLDAHPLKAVGIGAFGPVILDRTIPISV